ncbi:MAG TPA: type I phosphomannose isomerase catalytic subunit [Tepidisphaeraceae bacterium]
MSLYPLKFKPRLLPKMWGGRKIESILGKTLPPGPIGESWELYDFPPGVVENSAKWVSSEVAEGPLAGKTLHELVGEYRRDLYGNVPLVGPEGQFPILIKFLDAGQDLSVQVHPDEAYAKANPGAHLKNEAWFVVQADQGSRILKGLRPGVTRDSFSRAIADGSVEKTINSVPVKAGDCYYLPSGTVHALGTGILAAEVQTPSDTTFRVFDFNRVDPSTGKLRTLHVEQAMKCIDFAGGADGPKPSTGPELVKCDYFTIRRVALKKGQELLITGGEPIVLMFIDGQGQITSGERWKPADFTRGDTILLPAMLKETIAIANSDSLWLEVKLGNSSRIK